MHKYKLDFILNTQQKDASGKIVEHFKNKDNIILEAVCGAGKTEMLLEVISYALQKGYNVGFACPRRQLTIELYERMNDYFYIHSNIGLVVGGIQINSLSNLLFLTTHQLVNYEGYFDLLIIDEVDAFPYYNNIKLEQAALKSAKHFIYLSATMPIKYLKNKDLIKITNYKRHHLKIMPIPKFKVVRFGLMSISLIKIILKLKNNPLLIFVPCIKDGKRLNKLLHLFYLNSHFVYSNNLNSKVIESFKKRDIKILISTTVLERGITLENLNVIVFKADHKIFNEDVLIQISGRVGRSTLQPKGELIFLANNISLSMNECLNKLEYYNDL